MHFTYLIVFCASLNYARAVTLSKFPKLLVVAFDGFRWDFINEHKTPKLYRIAKQGAWARNGIKNGFITLTAPLFYSMSTGLHQESTGILGNTMYDPRYGGGKNSIYDYFGFGRDIYIKSRSKRSFWYSGVPIWQANDDADPGRKSGCMGWPISDAYVNGKQCYKYRPWGGYANNSLKYWKAQVDEMLLWYQDDKDPINLGLLYFSQPDTAEHKNDIYGSNIQKVLNRIDQLAEYLMDKMKSLGLAQKINVIFTGDHGHTNVYKEYTTININKYINRTWYIRSDAGYHPNVSNGINSSALYDAFYKMQQMEPKFYLYCKSKAEIPSCVQETPEQFYYKNCPRTPPIVASPYLGYYMLNARFKKSIFGSHGYSPEYQEMWPLFFGTGPQFREWYEFWNTTYQIDLFELMCAILDVAPAPNNGSLHRIGHMLKEYNNRFTITTPETTPSQTVSYLATKHPLRSYITVIARLAHYSNKLLNIALQ